jgi:hypothetical protein
MLLVVGGHSRKIGKTSVAAGLIRELRDCRWTALKITQDSHGVCSHAGQPCGCETEPEHQVALTEEYEPDRSDSGRFLTAGAVRSYWLRTPAGGIAAAEPLIRRMIEANPNLIVESNSVLEIVNPDLYLMVLDFTCEDFKASSLRFIDRADAFVVIDRGLNGPLWAGVARGLWESKPRFLLKPPDYAAEALSGFVRSRLG